MVDQGQLINLLNGMSHRLTHGHTDSQTNTDSPAHALTPG